MNLLASYYTYGQNGVKRDLTKAIELMQKASELGCPEAFACLGNMYANGTGVPRNIKKARHYFGLGAIGGNLDSRHNLACLEEDAGNFERAYKHYLIAAKAGDGGCLKDVKKGFEEGFVTKEEYKEALQAYQKQCDETKSAMRDEALAYEANPALYWQ